LVVKGDVSGSVEAVVGALQGIGNKDAVVKVVTTGVGDVSESDVMMAKAAEGMVVAFSVNTPRAVEGIAASNNIPLYSSTIIYRVMEEIRNRVIALLPPVIEQKVTGEANVLQLFDIHIKSRHTKQVAGCRVINGLVEMSRHGRVVRDGITIHEGPLETLKHGKKDMTEIRKGMECGLSFAKFDQLREGDLIQMYQDIEKPGIL
jgi:translation initiation factor IF-2